MSQDDCKATVRFCEECGTGHINAAVGCLCYLCDGRIGGTERVLQRLASQPRDSVTGGVTGTLLSREGVDALIRLWCCF